MQDKRRHKTQTLIEKKKTFEFIEKNESWEKLLIAVK